MDSIVAVDYTDQSGTVLQRIPSCDVTNSGRNRCIDGGGGNGNEHKTEAHKDVEVEIAVHAFLGVRTGHCNQHFSNGHLCLLPSFCWESYCVQEVVSTVMDKKDRSGGSTVRARNEKNTEQNHSDLPCNLRCHSSHH